MNKKAFTLIELLAVIVILSIIMILATIAINRYLFQSKNKSFDILVDTFEDGALQGYTECLINGSNTSIKNYCDNHKLTGNEVIVLKDLIDYGFVESFKNPYNTDETCDLTLSTITITANTSVTTNYRKTKLYDYLLDINPNYTYKTCLICGDKVSEGCQ